MFISQHPQRWTVAEDYQPTCVAASRRKNLGKAGFFRFDRIPVGQAISETGEEALKSETGKKAKAALDRYLASIGKKEED